jgi:2-polyprenyl-6-methoxyphenol hydroxylase-like FAD-dependent oxidoreductase
MTSNPPPLWDAIVVGAGVAGSVVSTLLARRRWNVLLLEKSTWPRDKACGGCLNGAGVALLHACGLGDVLAGAAALRQMQLRTAGRAAEFSLPPGAVVERRLLDARLVKAATTSGTSFVAGASARLLPEDDTPWPSVRVTSAKREFEARGRVILACDGLGASSGGFLRHLPWGTVTIPRAGRLGFSMTVFSRHFQMPPATLVMCMAPEGYAGVVTSAAGEERPRVHIGAALRPEACHARRGPRAVIADILMRCRAPDFDPSPLADAVRIAADFTGTGMLTRHRSRVAHGRVLAIGDACGYVEPFTGEGMAWAIRGALAVANLLPRHAAAVDSDIGSRWNRLFESDIRPRQRWCNALRHLINNPLLSRVGVRVAQVAPWGAARIARHISAG